MRYWTNWYFLVRICPFSLTTSKSSSLSLRLLNYIFSRFFSWKRVSFYIFLLILYFEVFEIQLGKIFNYQLKAGNHKIIAIFNEYILIMLRNTYYIILKKFWGTEPNIKHAFLLDFTAILWILLYIRICSFSASEYLHPILYQ